MASEAPMHMGESMRVLSSYTQKCKYTSVCPCRHCMRACVVCACVCTCVHARACDGQKEIERARDKQREEQHEDMKKDKRKDNDGETSRDVRQQVFIRQPHRNQNCGQDSFGSMHRVLSHKEWKCT